MHGERRDATAWQPQEPQVAGMITERTDRPVEIVGVTTLGRLARSVTHSAASDPRPEHGPDLADPVLQHLP